MNNVLIHETLGPVARLTLNRPKAMNALNSDLVQALSEAFDRIGQDAETRAVIVTGAGAAFCAGADLKDALQAQTPVGEPDFLDRAGALFERISAFDKPVIAALNGVTMAGGLELAMCADIIVASVDASIGDAHANYGVFPGAGGAAVLPRLLPQPTAMYLLFTGKTLPAQRLHELGLICEVHPTDRLADSALELARTIAQRSPSGLRRMKAVARATSDKTRADALLHERVMLREHLRSADMQEGLRAFAEKRAPQFTGR
jgi:enoyl-CoA hydratase/carnithine racemase